MSDPVRMPMIVLCGPSGAGKDSLLAKLLAHDPTRFQHPIGYTTRPMGVGEKQHQSYHFISQEEFRAKIDTHEFIEHIEIRGNLYGLDKRSVSEIQGAGKQCVLILNQHGCEQFRSLGLDPRVALILAPSFDETRNRLVARARESDEEINKRMDTAATEMTYYADHPDLFECTVINEELEEAFGHLLQWIDRVSA